MRILAQASSKWPDVARSARLEDERLRPAADHAALVEEACVGEADSVVSEHRSRVETDPLAEWLACDQRGHVRIDEGVSREIPADADAVARVGRAGDALER